MLIWPYRMASVSRGHVTDILAHTAGLSGQLLNRLEDGRVEPAPLDWQGRGLRPRRHDEPLAKGPRTLILAGPRNCRPCLSRSASETTGESPADGKPHVFFVPPPAHRATQECHMTILHRDVLTPGPIRLPARSPGVEPG